ncbi:MAG: RHS repeat-associated core domain-containing protein [Candidatus Dormibacteraceae bacterium]
MSASAHARSTLKLPFNAAAKSTTVLAPIHPDQTAGAGPTQFVPFFGSALGTLPPASNEIPALRTRFSDTFAVSGGFELINYSGPINYATSAGTWQPIDNTLVASSTPGFRWQNAANSYSVLLPSSLGAGPVKFVDANGSLSFRLAGAGSSAGQLSGSTVTYSNALPGVTVQLTAENGGLKESLLLAGPNSPSQFTYAISLGSGLSAIQNANGSIDFAGPSAKALFSIDPPNASDASGAASRVTSSLSGSGSARTLMMSLESAWASSVARQWPVTIDPSINYNANQACEIQNAGHANTNECGDGTSLYVGYDGTTYVHRSLMQFNVQNSIPVGAQVTHAGLAVYLNSTSTTNYGSVSAYQLTQAWTTALTWNQYDGTNAWTNAGGTFNSTALASQTPNSAGWWYWHSASTTALAQGWLNNPSTNDGIILTADSETNNEVNTFGSGRGGTTAPYFYVYYVNALGRHPTYTMESHSLTDRSTLAVNVANGNLVVQANDLNIRGTGINESVSRVYNSLGASGAFGDWVMTTGVDENLAFFDTANARFQGPGGYAVVFAWNGTAYTPPPGVEANLVKNGDGSYTLTYNATGEQLKFNSSGVLMSDVDRNGNTISFTTSSGNVTSITDTQNRSTTLSYSSPVAGNLVSGISDSTSRSWAYTYQNNNGAIELTQYTDPNSKSTQYSYTDGRLTQITDPLGNQTKFGYDSSSRVTSITYVTDPVHGTGPTTNYTYNTGAGSCGTPPSGQTYFGNTVAQNADGNSTTYCYNPQGQVIETINPASDAPSKTFTSDKQVATSTDALSQTTTNSFNGNNDLTQVTTPVLGSGQTAPSWKASFNTPSSVTGYQFLASSVTDPQGNCTAYVYDSAGNVTDTYQGQTSPCDGHTGGTHLGRRYQGDTGVSCGAKTGELCSVFGGNGASTSYGYDSNGNITSVMPPSPLGGTTITIDALSRTATVTDGKGQKTTYSYDTLDRVTQVLFNGASMCVPSNGNCITYGYDADGNRTSMVDQSGTSSYYHDALNRLTTQSLPDSSSVCSGSSPAGITFSYDGVGNLLTSCDSGGTTTYAYDKDNRLTSIAEPGGNCGPTPSLCTTFGYNTDGNRTTITFPGGGTQTTLYDNGQDVSSVVGKNSTGGTITSFAYTYVNGANDTPLVQTTTENDAVAANTYTYSYDALNRLKSASVTSGSGTSYSYTYDSDSNMLTKTAGSTTTTYAYNSADELCWGYAGTSSNGCSSAPTGATTYSFDGNGNETGTSAGGSFGYNPKNQTTSITYGGSTISSLAYTDGGQQQRISAGSTNFDNEQGGVAILTSGGSSTYFLRDTSGDVLGERIGSNHYYFLSDHLGSVVAVISGDGQTVSDRYGYDPYGNTTYRSGTVSNPWGYVGGYTDATGLVKFGARYYDPSTARWTQTDPLIQTPENPYSYVAEDPINAADPTGCFNPWSWHCWALLGLAIHTLWTLAWMTYLFSLAIAAAWALQFYATILFIWAAFFFAAEAFVSYWLINELIWEFYVAWNCSW